MKKDIRLKLLQLLDRRGAFDERSVVYLFVEMRKILEKDGVFMKFPRIAFYGDWVVHSSLDRKPSQEYLRRIEGIFTGEWEHDCSVHVSKEIRPFFNFNELKFEISLFIKEELGGSDTIFLSEWPHFLDRLISILIDSPLIMRDTSSIIEQFTFKPQMVMGDIIFELKLRSGITHHVSTDFLSLDL